MLLTCKFHTSLRLVNEMFPRTMYFPIPIQNTKYSVSMLAHKFVEHILAWQLKCGQCLVFGVASIRKTITDKDTDRQTERQAGHKSSAWMLAGPKTRQLAWDTDTSSGRHIRHFRSEDNIQRLVINYEYVVAGLHSVVSISSLRMSKFDNA